MSKVAFIFPGHGSQYAGMGRSLYESFDIAKNTFKEASDLIGMDVKRLCFNRSYKRITDLASAQLAILTISVAAFRVLKKESDIDPDFLAGNSFGELSALVCSNALNFKDALKIAKFTGDLVKKEIGSEKYKMIALSIDDFKLFRQIQKKILASKNIYLAMYNSGKQIVVSGDKEEIMKFKKYLEGLRINFTDVNVIAPFHTPILKSAEIKTRQYLKNINFEKPIYPVVSNLNEKIINSGKWARENISRNLTQKINWHGVIKKLISHNVKITIEVGPRKILSNLIKENYDDIAVYPMGTKKDLELIKDKFSLDKVSSCNIIEKCLKIAVSSRNNSDNTREYEKFVAEYRKVNKKFRYYKENNKTFKVKEVLEAVSMLKNVLEIKNTSRKELQIVMEEILDYRQMHFSKIKKLLLS